MAFSIKNYLYNFISIKSYIKRIYIYIYINKDKKTKDFC